MRQRHELVERALEVSPFVVLVADAREPDFPIVYASGSLERITGYRPDEVLGRNARMFQGPHQRGQAELETVRHALATGESCDVVVRNQRKDGTEFFNRLFLSPVRDERGVITHVIAIQKDVSAREDMLTRLRAADAGETSQRMLGGAVHDLWNILSVLGAQLEMARDALDDRASAAESLEAASEALERAASLTRLLLTPVTRARSTSTTPVRDALQTIKSVSRYALPRNVTLCVDAVADDAIVVVDRGALEQVLLNLVLNASEAMPAGGTIRVGVERGIPRDARERDESQASTADLLTIAVNDDGPGMADDVLAHLFEPYFTTKPPGKGTGLGLATCAALVTGAGGRLRVRSRPGEGSTFYVTLQTSDTTEATIQARDAAVLHLRGVDALVIEPDAGLRAALSTALRRRGASVSDAPDVESARSLAAGLGPNAVLVIDGSNALPLANELVAEWLAAPDRKAVVLDEPDEAPRVADARRASLPKPLDVTALWTMLARLTAAPRSDGNKPLD